MSYACLILVSMLLIFSTPAEAQLKVRKENNYTKMVNQVLVGSGVEVRNVLFRGDTNAIGIFDGRNSNIGLDSGIIISSGKARDAVGPNNDKVSTSNQKVGDGDLNSILSGSTTNDAASLQFEFIPVSSITKFRFVFASEEYPEWVGYPFNDIFGFFLSGPNIVGKKNIALIPGTQDPISIKTINHLTNSNLYVDNAGGATVQYDGFTNVIEIVADNLIPCEKYVIKMVIADVEDYAYDSGFFLEALSFKSESENEARVSIVTPPGINIIQEKCDSSVVRFSRLSSNTSKKLTVKFTSQGSATPGVDYINFPDSVVIQAGNAFADLIVFPIDDNLTETPEGIKFVVTSNGACSKSEDSLTIKDFDTLKITSFVTVDCQGDTIFKQVKYTGGSTRLAFLWTDSLGAVKSASSILTASPDSLTMYIISIYDSCINYTSKDTIYIPPITPVILTSSKDTVVCAPVTIPLHVNSTVPGLHYQWTAMTPDFQSVGVIANDTLHSTTYTVPSGVYEIIITCAVTDENYCAEPATYKVLQIPKGIYGPAKVFACKGDTVKLRAFGGGTYNWDINTGIISDRDTSIVTIIKAGVYNCNITDTVNCLKIASVEVQYDTLPFANAGEDVFICERSSILLTGGGSDYGTYEWSPGTSLNDATSPTPLASPTKTTTYYLKAINHACFSYDSVTIYVIEKPELEVDYSFDSCAKTIAFTNTTPQTDSFYWDFGDFTYSKERNPVHLYDTTGVLQVTIIANKGTDCTDTAIIDINLQDIDPNKRVVPNVFSPNGDGKNDVFKITGGNVGCAIEKMSIYNRWGKLLHEISNVEVWEWDGKVGSEIVPPGVYFYSIIGRGFEDVGMINVMY